MSKHRLILDHLSRHLTDGRWHDDCRPCQNRRINGGTGVSEQDERNAKLDLAKERYTQAQANGWTVVAMHDGNWPIGDVKRFIETNESKGETR